MKTVLSWSSGKDSAWSLHVLRQKPEVEVVGLLTTVNAAFNRVAMHGVRNEILQAQAVAAGLPLHVVELPWPCPNEEYEKRMGSFVEQAMANGVEAMAFGDLFLEDIRKYRENKLSSTGLRPVFPLWLRDTTALAHEMIGGGLETWVSVIDQSKLDASFAGRRFDASFLADLPAGIDPCGENGEFHTCVTAGPMFSAPIAVKVGETVLRDGFAFADLALCP